MKRSFVCLVILFIGLLSATVLATPGDVIYQSGFEQGEDSWRVDWCSESIGSSEMFESDSHSGMKSLRIQTSETDCASLVPTKSIQVVPGRTYEMSVWVKLAGYSKIEMGSYLDNSQGVLEWSGIKEESGAREWTKITYNLVISNDVNLIIPNIIVSGDGSVLMDDFQVVESEPIVANSSMPDTLTISNNKLIVEFDTKTLQFSVLDKVSNKKWTQVSGYSELMLLDAKSENNIICLDMYLGRDDLKFTAELSLNGETSDLSVKLSGAGALSGNLSFPAPFLPEKGMSLIFPLTGGISIPVDDLSVPTIRQGYGGNTTMPFFGMTDGRLGFVAIVNTPDDCVFHSYRHDDIHVLTTTWISQKKQFGPDRTVTFSFFEEGGVTALAKRYRQEADKLGYLVTLEDKKLYNTNVDKIVGSASMHAWDESIDPKPEDVGMTFSFRTRFTQTTNLDDYFVAYSIFSDVGSPLNPDSPPEEWNITRNAWKKDEVIGENGLPVGLYNEPGFYAICNSSAMKYAKLWDEYHYKNHMYPGRFIDAFFNFKECYSPEHPITRTQSKEFARDVFHYYSAEKKLVVGMESCVDCFVPDLVYNEGCMSLAYDTASEITGTPISEIIDYVPESVDKYLVNIPAGSEHPNPATFEQGNPAAFEHPVPV